jgi:hypothetical protein
LRKKQELVGQAERETDEKGRKVIPRENGLCRITTENKACIHLFTPGKKPH